MAIVYIGIGSNLGDRHKNCLMAIALLRQNGLLVTKQSSMYETEPWGVAEQPAFVNMAVEIDTELAPMMLLCLLKKIEKAMGRQEALRWGPRIADLDILLYNDITLNTDALTIPHPLIHEREFVLKPLSEIAKDFVHPVLKKRIGDLMSKESKLRKMGYQVVPI
ncbi:MAG: 2-amino-4-hydroxy-6-hydroxymethyldihydropteridine diphosphokinase [Nitrospira bacterium HGW-Nitrospira-1]|nr:MAG: 2-amino-4-hydroxy-6-hydroxymethyldihydropteridine diphosphokinase [Nitrospira bacterium HGW-Nitrospira-1]